MWWPAASLYSVWHSGAFHALALAFLGSDDMYIDNFLPVGQSILVGQISL